jgi:hypothetical protein
MLQGFTYVEERDQSLRRPYLGGRYLQRVERAGVPPLPAASA